MGFNSVFKGLVRLEKPASFGQKNSMPKQKTWLSAGQNAVCPHVTEPLPSARQWTDLELIGGSQTKGHQRGSSIGLIFTYLFTSMNYFHIIFLLPYTRIVQASN
jgi:hypothetical protein